LNTLADGAPENPVADKSFGFAVRIVKMYRHLRAQGCEVPLADQILRCGTSIGANVEEALGAFTPKEFASKMGISYKEARETCFWLRLLYATDSLSEPEFRSMYTASDELCRLLRSIVNTTRQKTAKSSPKRSQQPKT
jgi:four helix bundle protein